MEKNKNSNLLILLFLSFPPLPQFNFTKYNTTLIHFPPNSQTMPTNSDKSLHSLIISLLSSIIHPHQIQNLKIYIIYYYYCADSVLEYASCLKSHQRFAAVLNLVISHSCKIKASFLLVCFWVIVA